jgi:hypothetical protein
MQKAQSARRNAHGEPIEVISESHGNDKFYFLHFSVDSTEVPALKIVDPVDAPFIKCKSAEGCTRRNP